LWLGGVALLILLQFWWVPGDPGTPDDTYSVTVEGKRGFFQTLEGLSKAGVLPPVRRENMKLIPDRTSTLVLLSPDRYPNEHEQKELAEFVMNGGSLLFAPNWLNPESEISQLNIKTRSRYFGEEDTSVTAVPAGTTPPVPNPQVAKAPEGEDSDADSDGTLSMKAEADEAEQNVADSTTSNSAKTPNSTPKAEKSPQETTQDMVDRATRQGTTLQPPSGTPTPNLDDEVDYRTTEFLVESPLVKGGVPWRTKCSLETVIGSPTILAKTAAGTTQAAAWKYGNGHVVVCASADVFSNRAMLDEQRAELAIRLTEYTHAPLLENSFNAEAPIVISEFLNASDSYRGTAVLMSPSLRSGTLQLMTIAVLAGWLGFHQFGPPKRTNTFQRRSLTESATAVGNLQFRTNSGPEALSRYLDYFRTQLRKHFGSAVRIEDRAAIAMRAGMDTDDVKTRIATAVSLSQITNASSADAANAIRGLAEILDRLTGSRHQT